MRQNWRISPSLILNWNHSKQRRAGTHLFSVAANPADEENGLVLIEFRICGTHGLLNGLTDIGMRLCLNETKRTRDDVVLPPSLAESEILESRQWWVRATATASAYLHIQTGIATSRYRHYLTHSWKHVLPCSGRRDNLDQIANLVRHYDIVGLQEADAGSLRSSYLNLTSILRARRVSALVRPDESHFGMFAQHSMGVLTYAAAEIREHACQSHSGAAPWLSAMDMGARRSC